MSQSRPPPTNLVIGESWMAGIAEVCGRDYFSM
jgi:hypothetical protein